MMDAGMGSEGDLRASEAAEEGFCAMPVLRVAPGGYEEVSGG